ncbi:MAG TPA: DUF2723 domain-containing protein [Bacteroidales bacterium]|nr:DUF2723 domain-containing protein [Bacteroidales bacterium]
MRNFRLYNVAAGWIVFLVAAVTYLLTMEPTSSFWDCGEFIATAYKLEVGHPPGAPFFMILGRFFTLFAFGNEQAVAATMNALSALASAFTILFLFWTITHLVRKLYGIKESYDLNQLITMLGAGAVGALAYTFSDSFWFSAVEAEVYATSSLFTAFVFWAMLKWENTADDKYANRWLILIALVMGISIGTHLLNLLTIPALVFVYYFRKFSFSWRGFASAIFVSLLLLGFVMEVIIAGIPFFASRFDLFFVNSLGMPFFSGVMVYLALLFGLVIFGIYYTRRKMKVLWNTIFLGVFVLMVGYSSYAVIVIRSVANTPLDESNPETIFSLLSYLNREQYGSRPLFHGAYFNARPSSVEEGKATYIRREEGYEKTYRDRKYIYEDKFEGFFPRMWSTQDKHRSEYMYWGKLQESELYNVRTDGNGQPILGRMGGVQYDRNAPKGKPSFAKNMKFFVRYQLGHMYFRYFMWNFAGRQNDLQGHGEMHKGNWLSGIKFIDEARLGPQDKLPGSIKDNKAYNRYFMLPLLLGLVGLLYHYKKNKKDAWVVALLFILTGIAIVVYLNQYPLQPRERDYAYAGSFYAFAIWIGIGVAGLIEYAGKKIRSVFLPAGITLVTLVLVPGVMAVENWDDHDRSGRYTTTAFAKNYLNSCDENAIIFTNGDNDTFPLWYMQEVEGYRTDVRVVNLSYLTADWYIEQMMFKFYDSDPLPLSMSLDDYRQGTRDYVYLVETATTLIEEKYAVNRDEFEPELMALYDKAKALVERSEIPAGFPNDYKAFSNLETNMNPVRFFSYLRTFNNDDVVKRIKIDQESLGVIIDDLESLIRKIDRGAVPLKDAMDFLASDDPRFEDNRYFIPARKFILPVDSTQIPASLITDEVRKNMVDQVAFSVGDEVIYKNTMAKLDILATNEWKRPIYFSNTVSNNYFLNLENAFIQEGLAYRVAPIDVPNSNLVGIIDTDLMYQRMVEEFEWGGIEDPDIYLDENNIRMTIKYRYSFSALARALSDEGKYEKAVEVLDFCMKHMPHERVPFNFSMIPVIQSYYAAGEVDRAVEITEKLVDIKVNEIDYFIEVIQAKPAKAAKMRMDFLQHMRSLNSLSSVSTGFGEMELSKEITEKINAYVEIFENYFRL